MDDFDTSDDMNPYSSSLSVSYGGKDDTVHFRPGDDPTPKIHNRTIELHSTALVLWIFYIFGVALLGILAGSQMGPHVGLMVVGALALLTGGGMKRKTEQMFGIIAQWQLVMAGKPQMDETKRTPTDRVGPPAEWLD